MVDVPLTYCMEGGSEENVGDVRVSLDLQCVNLSEGQEAMDKVTQVLLVHEHRELLVITVYGDLREKERIKKTERKGEDRLIIRYS